MYLVPCMPRWLGLGWPGWAEARWCVRAQNGCRRAVCFEGVESEACLVCLVVVDDGRSGDGWGTADVDGGGDGDGGGHGGWQTQRWTRHQ